MRIPNNVRICMDFVTSIQDFQYNRYSGFCLKVYKVNKLLFTGHNFHFLRVSL